MSRTHACLTTIITASVFLSSCLGSLQAQQAPAAQAEAPKMPQRIQISVEVVDVPPAVMDQLNRTIPDGDEKAFLILEALYKNQLPDVVTMSLQTPNDLPGVASYEKIVGFTDKDHPGKNFVTLATSLEATPHIENNDIITIKLKTMFTEVSPAGLPNTIAQGITIPSTHLKNGLMAMFPGALIDHDGKPAKLTDSQTLVQVSFITAAVLPTSSEAAPG